MALNANEQMTEGRIRDLDSRLLLGVPDLLTYVSVSTAASGQTAIVAAAGAGNKIKVISYVLVAASAVTVQWQSAAVALTGVMSLGATGGLVVVSSGNPLFETAANAALNLNLGTAVQVSGHIAYVVGL